ncbi:hypothetical protein AVEN_143294-1 [Araneus ventricosus]|uniref:Uncharacterized protein n=1 Tax=Araneus ventricosus TaxID=182803 RepID=A0A4Y2AF69_ARAVE|nr:hypothetical protein AVEN_143294-1 [Araneus ventricosus]
MNAVSIPGSEELEVLSPSCIEIVQLLFFEDPRNCYTKKSKRLVPSKMKGIDHFGAHNYAVFQVAQSSCLPMNGRIATCIGASDQEKYSESEYDL